MSISRPLIRHFLGSLIGRGVLQDDGVEAVRGLLFGVAALFISVGLLLPRQFHRIYLELSYLPDPEPFRRAIVADGMFMLAIPFLVALVVAALVAPAIFPDEVDYLTLVPLPISRRRIFMAKLAALGIFVGSLLATLGVCSAISFPMFTHQRWAEGPFLARVLAHFTASAATAAFGFGCVVAIQGCVAAWLPRRWLPRLAVIVPGVIIASVVLAIPFVLQIPGQRQWVATEPWVLRLFPPAWFVGLERSLLGVASDYWQALARVGLLAIGGVAALAAIAYLFLYRHFERLVLPTPRRAERHTTAAAVGVMDVWPFTVATLLRNRVPLLIYLVFLSLGVGVATLYLINGVLTDSFRWDEPASVALSTAGVAMPLVIMLAGLTGLRTAFQLPVHSRANWIFRLSDAASARARYLRAIDRACLLIVVLPALVVTVPLQIGIFQGDAPTIILLTTLTGAVMCEMTFAGWQRVPFTCTWIPGKRPLVFTLLGALLVLMFILSLLTPLIRLAPFSWPLAATLTGILICVRGWLRQRRVRAWQSAPLQFEDESEYRIQTLQLS